MVVDATGLKAREGERGPMLRTARLNTMPDEALEEERLVPRPVDPVK